MMKMEILLAVLELQYGIDKVLLSSNKKMSSRYHCRIRCALPVLYLCGEYFLMDNVLDSEGVNEYRKAKPHARTGLDRSNRYGYEFLMSAFYAPSFRNIHTVLLEISIVT